MGAVESVSGSEEAKAREEEIISKGRSEIERGVAQIKGTAEPGAASTTAAKPQVGTQTGGQPQAQQSAKQVSGTTQAPAPPEPAHGATVGTETQQTESGKSGQEQAAQIDPSKTQKAGQETPLAGKQPFGCTI